MHLLGFGGVMYNEPSCFLRHTPATKTATRLVFYLYEIEKERQGFNIQAH
jgi:hypothetical protein